MLMFVSSLNTIRVSDIQREISNFRKLKKNIKDLLAHEIFYAKEKRSKLLWWKQPEIIEKEKEGYYMST